MTIKETLTSFWGSTFPTTVRVTAGGAYSTTYKCSTAGRMVGARVAIPNLGSLNFGLFYLWEMDASLNVLKGIAFRNKGLAVTNSGAAYWSNAYFHPYIRLDSTHLYKIAFIPTVGFRWMYTPAALASGPQTSGDFTAPQNVSGAKTFNSAKTVTNGMPQGVADTAGDFVGIDMLVLPDR